jgi:hypothetical protein
LSCKWASCTLVVTRCLLGQRLQQQRCDAMQLAGDANCDVWSSATTVTDIVCVAPASRRSIPAGRAACSSHTCCGDAAADVCG